MAVAFWAAPSVSADFIETSVEFAVGGGFTTEHIGFATGTITYRVGLNANEDHDHSFASLVISLTNTSPGSNGGFITGFAFRINGEASANFFNAPTGWQAATAGFMLDLSPFSGAFDDEDAFEAGAELPGSSMPQSGIGVDDTLEFRWDMTGADRLSLTAMDFILGDTLPAADGFTDEDEIQFVLRFKGFINDDPGSDKSQAVIIPLPAALPMGLVGLLGMVVMRRRWASTLTRSRSGRA